MNQITHAEASANILRAVADERVIQGRWHGRADDGRDTACLLGSIHPSVTSPAECNGDLMPMWLAELTPALFDGVASNQIHSIARRYGELVGRWHVLQTSQWNAILNRFLIRTIDEAIEAARPAAADKIYWPQVEEACTQVSLTLKGQGDIKAAGAAARAAGAAAEAAARAAGAAAGAAARAARAAAGAAWAARAAAGAAAEAAAYLKLFNFLLDQIEMELPR